MPVCHHLIVEMTLRFEIFPDDLDATVDFYMRVLRFRLTADRRDQRDEYVCLQRGSVRVGAAWGSPGCPCREAAACRGGAGARS